MLGAAGMGVVPQLGAAENEFVCGMLPNPPLAPKLGAAGLGAEAAAALAADSALSAACF
jgi:hypothetical protein